MPSVEKPSVGSQPPLAAQSRSAWSGHTLRPLCYLREMSWKLISPCQGQQSSLQVDYFQCCLGGTEKVRTLYVLLSLNGIRHWCIKAHLPPPPVDTLGLQSHLNTSHCYLACMLALWQPEILPVLNKAPGERAEAQCSTFWLHLD
jgi:hypothetical protein